MRTILMLCCAMLVLTACDSHKNTSNETASSQAGSAGITSPTATLADAKDSTSPQEIFTAYLQIKNALVNDDPAGAAARGNDYVKALGKINISTLTASQQKQFNDLTDDAKEMAEHIGKTAVKMAHQREHFDMLSKDMYDMANLFKPTQTLYIDYCPMYNNKKGAIWLSETEEIRNPYFGRQMPLCGEVKEEIK